MPGWEGLVRVSKVPNWGSNSKASDYLGVFLNVDSVTPTLGAQIQERDNKMDGNREPRYDSFSVDNYFPTCQLKWQPRADDLLPFLMAFFQHAVITDTGTWAFSKAERNLTWNTGGSNYGTNVYGLNLDICYGQSFTDGWSNASGTQANGIRLFNGIVDKLTIDLRYGEDLIVTADMKFLTGSYYKYGTDFVPLSLYGSFSALSRLVDYHGTIANGTETYELDSWQAILSNNTSDKAKIGQRGYSRFPYSGRFKAEGQVEMELARDLNVFAEGCPFVLSGSIFSAAGNAIHVIHPNAVYRAHDIPVNGGDSIIGVTLPYRAYPTSTGSNSTIIYVYTGSTYGAGRFGFGGTATDIAESDAITQY